MELFFRDMPLAPVQFRKATPADAPAIARIHTINWQQNYRGAFTDEFLDDELPAAHLAEWRKKFQDNDDRMFLECAVDGDEIIGFLCGYADHDAEWGAFIDNLHVTTAAQGRGVGAMLMMRFGKWLDDNDPESPIYLFVLESNTAAERFYQRIGGQNAGVVIEELHGCTVRSLRYVWPSPTNVMERIA